MTYIDYITNIIQFTQIYILILIIFTVHTA